MSLVALAAVDVTAPAQSLLLELVSGRETPWIVRERAAALCVAVSERQQSCAAGDRVSNPTGSFRFTPSVVYYCIHINRFNLF